MAPPIKLCLFPSFFNYSLSLFICSLLCGTLKMALNAQFLTYLYPSRTIWSIIGAREMAPPIKFWLSPSFFSYFLSLIICSLLCGTLKMALNAQFLIYLYPSRTIWSTIGAREMAPPIKFWLSLSLFNYSLSLFICSLLCGTLKMAQNAQFLIYLYPSCTIYLSLSTFILGTWI